MMEIDEARRLAEGLMRDHRLNSWTLVFDNARTRAGVCRFGRREIGLSRVLTALHAPELVRETVLHEIAHVLAGPEHGHDAVWRATARSIGGSGTRCVSPSAPRAAANWVGTCARGHQVLRHRRPAPLSACSACGRRFDAAYLLVWRFRGRQVPLSALHLAELARVEGLAGSAGSAAGVPGGAALFEVGAEVILGGSGKYAGLRGRIEKRGRTRYRVVTPIGTLTAPFAAVRAQSW